MSTSLRMIKTECRRAFGGRLLAAALVAGLALTLAHLITVAVPYGTSDVWEVWRSGAKGAYPFSVYNTWMGGENSSAFTTLYYFLLPLLACVPFADSLYTDLTSGYAAQMISRTGRGTYCTAKVLAVALSAGTVVLVPLVVNFLGTLLFVPLLPPEAAAGIFFVGPSAAFADVFYEAPLAYCGLFALLTFCVAGIIACLCVALAPVMPNRFLVLVTPFLLCTATSFVLAGSGLAGYAPTEVLMPAPRFDVQPAVVAVAYGLIAGAEAVAIARHARTCETL